MLRHGRADIGWAILGLLLNVFAVAQIIDVVDWERAQAVAIAYGAGQSCAMNSECASGHCVDRVCCIQASCASFEACNLPGFEGTCTRRSPAPALSAWVQLFVGTALLVYAWRRLSGTSRAR
jgi:hypothetical protein